MFGNPATVEVIIVTSVRTRIPRANIRFRFRKGIRFEIIRFCAPGGVVFGNFGLFRQATISEATMARTVTIATMKKGRAP